MKLQLDLNNFEGCPEYNQWLDERHLEQAGPLDILGFQPPPSLVLFSLSQDTYQAAFDDFRREREEELKELVFREFPTPIAHYYYRFENGYENELQRLHLLRDTWEATIDVLHAIVVSECRFRAIKLVDPIIFRDLLTDSVAQRLLNMERIVTQCAKDGQDLRSATIVSMSTLLAMRELNQSRNGFAHSAAQSESQAQTWIGECYGDVMGVLDDLRSLADVKVVRHMSQLDPRTLRCEVFRGYGFTKTINNLPLTDHQVQESQAHFRQGQILAFVGDIIFSVRPLIYSHEDPSGHSTKLCMFRRTRGDGPSRRVEYEVVGDAVRLDEDRALFRPDIDELRALFNLPADSGT